MLLICCYLRKVITFCHGYPLHWSDYDIEIYNLHLQCIFQYVLHVLFFFRSLTRYTAYLFLLQVQNGDISDYSVHDDKEYLHNHCLFFLNLFKILVLINSSNFSSAIPLLKTHVFHFLYQLILFMSTPHKLVHIFNYLYFKNL